MNYLVALAPKTDHVPQGSRQQDDNSGLIFGFGAAAVGLLLIGPLIVTPWVIKQFKPEWPYSKRVAAGMAFSMGVGAVSRILNPRAYSTPVATSTVTSTPPPRVPAQPQIQRPMPAPMP